jgi:hypothetical protein
LHEIYTRKDQKEDFTPEQLIDKWLKFVSRLDDRPNLQSTLSNIPEIGENYELTLEIENTVQEDHINSIKTDLLSYLRIELKNSLIQLNTVIAQNTRRRIIYTDAEKYDELLKKNPQLAFLRQKLNLDFGN